MPEPKTKTRPKPEPEPEAVAPPPPPPDPAAERRSRGAHQYVGVSTGSQDGITYVDNPAGTTRERTIRIDGAPYEHVAEDADGVWIYRLMR